MHQPPSYFPLDYYRVSPVRGHLEPYDPASPRNWRYIQTTDTPNELKVLLPPPVASQYDQLLKIELAELGKRTSISWERILEIRHLKDRMIRKCQRLSRIIPPKRLGRGEPFVFQTLLAPEDFRLKEMEAWFQQDARSHKNAQAPPVKSRPVVHRPAAQKGIARNTCCTRCSRSTTPAPVVSDDTKSQRADHHSHEHHVHEQKTRSTDTSQTPTPERSPSPESPSSPETDADPTFPDSSSSAAQPEPDPPQLKLSEDNDGSSSDSSTVAPTPPPSPPPLPHLLRISDPSLLKDILHLEPETVDFIPAIDEIPSPPTRPSPTPVQLRPTLGRQRSCIKRASGDSVKTVSWADDHNVSDQIAKIAFFTAESPVEEPEHQGRSSDEDDEDDDDDGTDAMSRIDSLHLELKKSLEEAEADPAHFQLIESLISDHKQKMRNGIAHEGFPSALLEQVLEVDDEDSKLGDSDFDDI